MPSPPAPLPRPFAGKSLRGLNWGVGAVLSFRGAGDSGVVEPLCAGAGRPGRGMVSAEMTLGTWDGCAGTAVAGWMIDIVLFLSASSSRLPLQHSWSDDQLI